MIFVDRNSEKTPELLQKAMNKFLFSIQPKLDKCVAYYNIK